MHKVTININQSIYEHIMFFLKSLPKNMIDIQSEIVSSPKPSNSQNAAFGILNGRIKDPVAWQNSVREENERDVYGDISKWSIF